MDESFGEDGGRFEGDGEVEPAWGVGGDGGEKGMPVLGEDVAEVGTDNVETAVEGCEGYD